MARKIRVPKTPGESPVPLDITLELRAIGSIEAAYLKKESPNERVLLFDDLDIQWYWDESQVRRLRELWKEGLHPADIAKKLNIDQTSVGLCIWWQAETNKIHAREGGAYGSR